MSRISSIAIAIVMIAAGSGIALAQSGGGDSPQMISFGESFEGWSIKLQAGQRIRVVQDNGEEHVFSGEGIEAIRVPGGVANLLVDNSSEPAVGTLPSGEALVVFEPDGARSTFWGFPDKFDYGIEMEF